MMFPYLRFHLHLAPLDVDPPGRRERDGQPALSAPRLRRMLKSALLAMHCPFGDSDDQRDPPCQRKSNPVRLHSTARCQMAASCPHGVLFARGRTQRMPFSLWIARPDAIVELTLYGPAAELYPWALAGLRQALTQGLGRRRRRFRIERVLRIGESGTRPVAGAELSGLPACLEADSLRPEPLRAPPLRRLTLDFLSPVRLVRKRRALRQSSEFGFELLVSRTLDRFFEIYGQPADFDDRRRRELEVQASRLTLIEERNRFVPVVDYSARRRKEIRLDGFVGRSVYTCPPGFRATDLLPWLQAAEILHLGKNPAAGCGRLRVSAELRDDGQNGLGVALEEDRPPTSTAGLPAG